MARVTLLESGRRKGRVVMAHGGSDSKAHDKDGPEAAARAGLEAYRRTNSPVEAVVSAISWLEDDPRFAAGTGSTIRFDGRTVEMDAAVGDSRGRYGAVTCLQSVRHPVQVAAQLLDLPNNILCGPGATAFARALGHPPHDPITDRSREQWEETIRKIVEGEATKGDNEWDLETLRRLWNYERPFDEVFARAPPARRRLGHSSDTVGAVAGDARSFAAAVSTSGTTSVLAGRIGDGPVIGAGLFAGRRGAVVCSGLGDYILRRTSARTIYDGLAQKGGVRKAATRPIRGLPVYVDFLTLVLTKREWCVASNRDPAWAVVSSQGP